jgi:hypothetical protein
LHQRRRLYVPRGNTLLRIQAVTFPKKGRSVQTYATP